MIAGTRNSIDHLIQPIDDVFEPVTPAEVGLIEEPVETPLPPSCASFLTGVGSCMFAGQATVQACNGETLDIATFLGGRRSRSLLDELRRHEDYVAQKLVPIADTFFNDRYVLDPGTGKIHYIEYRAGKNRIVDVADLFDDFLMRITVEA